MSDKGKNGNPGPRLRILNYTFIAVAALICFFLIINTAKTLRGYWALERDTEDTILAAHDAADMQLASDYLTREVRAYTVTGDTEHIQLYFEEAKVTRRRDLAIESIRSLAGEEAALNYLLSAMNSSVELMNREYMAMRLVLEATGEELSAQPEELQAVTLPAQYAALSPQEKMEEARGLVFGEEYQAQKDDITRNVQACTDSLTETTRLRQLESSEQLLKALNIQQVLTFLMMMLLICLVLLITFLIIRPLEKCVQSVKADRLMAENHGANEVRFLAHNYNEMFERSQHDRHKLSYEATHDPLTGILNRKAYDDSMLEIDPDDVGLMLVDVDNFKNINDTYGHEAGDAVLKRVAQCLGKHFRSEDRVCRIGGDEFAVIMMRVSESLTPLVQNKIESIRETLRSAPSGQVPVTLSIGVAFGDRKNPGGSLFQDADKALYAVKEAGRNGSRIYDASLQEQKEE